MFLWVGGWMSWKAATLKRIGMSPIGMRSNWDLIGMRK